MLISKLALKENHTSITVAVYSSTIVESDNDAYSSNQDWQCDCVFIQKQILCSLAKVSMDNNRFVLFFSITY